MAVGACAFERFVFADIAFSPLRRLVSTSATVTTTDIAHGLVGEKIALLEFRKV